MEKEKRFLSVKDLQDMFGISRQSALSLIQQDGFPVMRIGKMYRIDGEQLEKWISENQGIKPKGAGRE